MIQIKLDRKGVDYIVSMVKDAGWKVLFLDTHETADGYPEVTFRLRQARTVDGEEIQPTSRLTRDSISRPETESSFNKPPSSKPDPMATLDD